MWRKKEGDEVAAGDVLCEIETVGLVFAGLRNTTRTCSHSNFSAITSPVHIMTVSFSCFGVLNDGCYSVNRIRQRWRWNRWKTGFWEKFLSVMV